MSRFGGQIIDEGGFQSEPPPRPRATARSRFGGQVVGPDGPAMATPSPEVPSVPGATQPSVPGAVGAGYRSPPTHNPNLDLPGVPQYPNMSPDAIEVYARENAERAAANRVAGEAGPGGRLLAAAAHAGSEGLKAVQAGWRNVKDVGPLEMLVTPPENLPNQPKDQASAMSPENQALAGQITEGSDKVIQLIGGLSAMPVSMLTPEAIASALLTHSPTQALGRSMFLSKSMGAISQKFGEPTAAAVQKILTGSASMSAFSGTQALLEGKDLGDAALAAGEGAVSGAVFTGAGAALKGAKVGVKAGLRKVGTMSDNLAATAYPDLVKPDESIARGTPEAAQRVAEVDAATKAQADAVGAADRMTATEKTPVEPARVSKAEIIDSIPGRQQDKFAIQNAVEAEPGEFVRTKVSAKDFQDIARENLDAETVRSYSGMETIAPPVIATTGEGGLLKLKDGRHRILAAALKAKEAGVDPNNATVDAYVPESWAKKMQAKATVVPPGKPVVQTQPAIPPTGVTNAGATSAANIPAGPGAGGGAVPPSVPPSGGPGAAGANPPVPGPSSSVNLPAKVALTATATPPVRQRTGVQAILRAFEDSASNRPQDYVRQRERLAGTKELARMDVVRGALKPYDKMLKNLGMNAEDRAVQFQVTEALRGRKAPGSMPPEVENWVSEQRKAIDAVETQIEAEARKLGMGEFADAVKDRMGTYLAVAPIKRAGQTIPGGSSRERLNPEVGHFRRDRYVVTDGNGRVVGDAQTLADAQALMTRATALRTGKAAMLTLHEPIPESWRMANEIHDPRFLVGRTMVEGVHLREMLKLLQEAKPHTTAPAKGLTSEQEAAWAKQNGLGKVVEDRRLGPISGKYLPVRMAEDFNEAIRLPNEIERLWLTFNSAWKVSKTAFNLPTSGHNVASNAVVFAHLDGISPMNPLNWKFYKQGAAAAVTKNNPVWRKMVEANFAGTGGRYAGELRGLLHDAANFDVYLRNSLLRAAKKGVQGVQEFYGAQDDVFKTAAVLKRVSKGMSVEDAIADARRWWPDNSRASKVAKWLSNAPLGSSFIRFTDQALRIAGRAAKEHPIRLAMIAALPVMMNALSRSWLGLKDEDSEEKMINENRSYAEPLTPWRDAKGRLQTFDMRYIIPLANDILPEQRYGMLKVPVLGNTPVATAMLEQFSGRDRFTGRQFVNDQMGLGDNLAARGGQLTKTLAPVPSMLTYGAKDIRDAATGQSERVLAHAILNQLTGVNIRTPYIAERTVRKIARNMLLTGDVQQSRELVETWNDKYKPGDQTDITMKDVAQGLRQQLASERTTAVKQATDLIFEGKDDQAAKVVEEYNRDRKIGRISLGAVKAEVRKQGAQNRRR